MAARDYTHGRYVSPAVAHDRVKFRVELPKMSTDSRKYERDPA